MRYLVIRRPKPKYESGMSKICMFVEAKNLADAKRQAKEIEETSEPFDSVYYQSGLVVHEANPGEVFYL